jgi:hypothetical protein
MAKTALDLLFISRGLLELSMHAAILRLSLAKSCAIDADTHCRISTGTGAGYKDINDGIIAKAIYLVI